MTPGEALARLFLDNADHGRNAANDELIAALRQRAREIQALTDVITPAGKETDHPMTTIVSIPATELITIEPTASVDTVAWSCRICDDHHGTTTSRETAHSAGVEHLTTDHHATTR